MNRVTSELESRNLWINGGIKVFKYEQVKDLNDLELEVYNYIMRHQEKVLEMKIRDLAEV